MWDRVFNGRFKNIKLTLPVNINICKQRKLIFKGLKGQIKNCIYSISCMYKILLVIIY